VTTERLSAAANTALKIERVVLVVTSGRDAGMQHTVDRSTRVIGAAPDCDIVLMGRGISKRHASVELTGERVLLRDLGSTNGTVLNSSQIREAFLAPGDLVTIGDVTLRLDELVEDVRVPPSASDRFGDLYGASPAMRQLFGVLERASATDTNVLVLGESGTGKDLVARAIHGSSRRAKGPFAVVDCSAQNAELLAAELFGHTAGAFTGAAQRRQGAFEAAARGTVFLDEVGELPLDLQPKFLRVLENREVRPLGANAAVPVDVRVVAATHRDLEAMVRAGTFREDLYYRLAVVQVHLPPLRERREDVPGLVRALLPTLRGVRSGVRFTDAALSALAAQAWRGNVRELRNVLERTVALAAGDAIDAKDLLISSRQATAPPVAPAPQLSGKTLEEIEREVIRLTLEKTKGNQTEAARILGLHRNGLAKKMKRYGLG
jgi:DNA-binding NtrC family response regulator